MNIKKMRGSKYKITMMNGEVITLQDQIIIDYNLLFRKEIDDQLRTTLVHENAYYEAYHKVVAYIVRKLRSRKEIVDYMKKYELTDKQKENMLQKLASLNLINDRIYAKSYVADKLTFTKEGPLKLRHDLEAQDISDMDIEFALEQVDDMERKEKIKRMIMKKIQTNRRYSNQVLRQKLKADLSRLGYDQAFIVDCLESVSFGTDHLIEKEYEKQYRRLAKKYSGGELQYKIKEKLYAKGYSMDTIRMYLEQKEI